MLAAGEDPLFIARRLIVFASEDVGNAEPAALGLATSCYLAVERIGRVEGHRMAVLHQARRCPEAFPRRPGMPAKRPLF